MNATREPPDNRLSGYRAKRSLGATPEPAGRTAPSSGRLFVVHLHAARRLHFDLRLEMHGVLESWAVPKGPSVAPSEKRLAVKVEDHPLEYGDFEGIIPEGNYGAGAVILWDRGVWVPLEDVEEGFEKGKLLFELRGYKLRGRWTLVKIKKSEKEWLLIKERDAEAEDEDRALPERSVLSGLTVEELRDGVDRGAEIRATLASSAAVRTAVQATDVAFQLAETRQRPFSKPGWVYEIKLDGFRMLAGVDEGEAWLRTRNGHDASSAFPEVIRALRALPFRYVVMDGEIVVHDEEGLPSFQRLQKRARLSRASDVRLQAVEHPATLYLFDLIGFEDFDVRPLPLLERKRLLRSLLPPLGPLKYSDHVDEKGEAFYAQVEKLGLEGIVAKRADAPYRGRRTADWVKVRADRTGDFVVVGYTAPKGARGGFGALHLAALDEGKLVYVGRVGSGFTGEQLDEMGSLLEAARRETPACEHAPTGAGHVWVDPGIVCEVRYKEWTEEQLLRQPVFLRFRTDKDAEECEHPGARPDESERDEIVVSQPVADIQRTIHFSNLDKVFWPEEGYTKGDLIEYYRGVAPWIMPYLEDRPVVMTRFPDGIDGKSFFQKDAPGFAPEWIRRETMWSEDTERDLNYFVVDSPEALLYIANLASIPLHIWASRVATLEQPDWCVLDLDPKDAPFTDVVAVAHTLRSICEEIDLPAFIKTSGQSGLHVMVPLGRQCTHDQSKTLGELVARVVTIEAPDLATTTRLPAQREGKVYVDYLQNGRGKLIVSPFCVRPYPGAKVSMPLQWEEVDEGLDPMQFTVANATERMERLGSDPLRPVLEMRPDLTVVLGKLAARLDS